MLNQVVIVGRMTHSICKADSIESKDTYLVTLNVPRNMKDEAGMYPVDSIPVLLVGSIADGVSDHATVGDLLGVKGRLIVINNTLKLYAEKVTFLSSNKGGE